MPLIAAEESGSSAAPARSSRRRSDILRRLRILSRRRLAVRWLVAAACSIAACVPPLAAIGLGAAVFWFHAEHLAANGPLLLSSPAAEQTALVVLLLLAVLAGTHRVTRRRYRRFFRAAGRAICRLGEQPTLAASRAVSDSARGLGAHELMRPLVGVAERYRQAIAQLAEMRAAFEGPDGSSSSAPSRSEFPSFPFERSRQQMVGRLAPNLHWQSATPLLQQVLGRSTERLKGSSFLSCVNPDDWERVQKALKDTLREGEVHNIVFRVLPPAPSNNPAEPPRYLQADILAYYDGAGRPEQIRCHFVDVTERILAEQALRRQTAELVKANERLQTINRDLERLKESYRDLYHHAPVMYFSLDEKGLFAAVNETMLRELAYKREEILGKPYPLVLSEQARDVYRQDPQVLRRPGEMETSWIGKDGRSRDVWIGITTIKDDRGTVIRSRCAAADITERNQLAQAAAGRARDLEQANTELRRINQELEEFTYVVSHDLKEPLRTLEAFSGFLASDYSARLDDDGREYISHLTAASQRLGKLIDDLLTLSRAGRVIGAARPLDWNAIVATVLADLQLLITRRPGCVIRVEGTLPPVQGDPERITQLLANLVSNALKYNESLTPEVVIGAAEGNGGFAAFCVRDNGMGIDPRYHEQIFRIFRRLHRRDEYEGTGAGLAICKKIIEAHGGRLWVESAPGQGSAFYFTLPRVAKTPQETKHAAAASGR